ncbi:hypothetical protein OROHE_004455 [Orobanche hederae]
MGNYKFRLSDMIPNAWFYKLKDMSKLNKNHHQHRRHKTPNPTTKKLHTPSSSSSSSSSLSSSASSLAPPPNNHPSEITKLPHLSDQRKSYYITRDLTLHPNSPIKTRTPVSYRDDFRTEPPRRSSRRRRSTKRNRIQHKQPAEQRLVSSSIWSGCSFRATFESVWTKPPPEDCADCHTHLTSSSDDRGSTLTENGSDRGLIPDDAFDDMRSSSNSSCKCTTGNNVVNIDVEDIKSVSDFDHHDLPPIITRKHHHEEPKKIQQRASHGSLSVKAVKAESFSSPVRRFSGNSSLSPGVKLRTNTPKIGNRRVQGRKSVSSTGGSRRSVSESFAVVKSSKDPGRDFKESMVEMILENNIRSSKDLEELLACYLSLNSDEYHELIIDVFKQIWFDFIRFRRK